MPCGYGTLRTTGVRIRHQVSRRPAQRSLQLQNLIILIVKSRSSLNDPPSMQVLSEVRENTVAQSESILQSSRGGWQRLEVLRSTGEGYRSVWEIGVWLQDWDTSGWWRSWSRKFGDSLGGCDWASLEIPLEAVIEWVWGYTWRPWSRELGGHNRASLAIHLEGVIMRDWALTWRPWSSEFGDTLEGHNCANLDAIIVRVWRYTWRLWLCQLRDALR